MRRSRHRMIVRTLAAALACLGGLATLLGPAAAAAAPKSTLAAYNSEAEFVDALTRWSRQAQRELSARGSGALNSAAPGAMADAAATAAPVPAAQAMAKSSLDAQRAVGAAERDSITNVQTAGVDEGGIVKRAGEHLVILRRGRLFTVRVGGDHLAPVASIDAYAPGSNPSGAWYDELLVSGSTVVVVGYSYARGGTEIGLFDLDRSGGLSYRATYHLRSFDYYSSRNYASRLIGSKLVFYSPVLLSPWQPQPWQQLPGFRRWHGQSDASGFERILPASRIFRTDDEFDPGEPLALHTLTTCDLAAAQLQCESSAVLGPAGRVFYVSQGSVFVWTTSARRRPWPAPQAPELRPVPPPERLVSAVFRIPLDGAAPSAIKTAGVPIDQMSFLEESDGHLNVLLRENGAGEGMWGSEHTRGQMALLRIELSQFGDGKVAARREHYRLLPAAEGHNVQNRFVGDWLLWGGAASRWSPTTPGRAPAGAWALRYAQSGAVPQALLPGHDVERIEALGRDAVLVGKAGANLHFSSVRLDRGGAKLSGRHVQHGAAQGETRSHGFFYRSTGDDEGLLALPILDNAGVRRGGVMRGSQGSAAVLVVRNRALHFSALGQLGASPDAVRDDACKASCVDWYGNARPIFSGQRIFALMGYELVEGQLSGEGLTEQLTERRRISFAPNGAWREGRYSPFN